MNIILIKFDTGLEEDDLSKRLFLGATLIIATTFVSVLAGVITLNSGSGIEFGVGQETTSTCSTAPRLAINSSFAANENLFVSNLTLTQIPVDCSGQRIELRLLGSNDQVLETVFWQLSRVNVSDTSITAIADGSTTSTSNTSTNSISLNYPNADLNDPDPGLALETIDVADVLGYSLISSEQ